MRPIIELIRLEENEKYGTFGSLLIQKRLFCTTLEPADHENKKNISSIPVQQYTCKRMISPKFGETFEVMNVPDRDDVLFHSGNLVSETEGCIILAQYPGKLMVDNIQYRAVLNSGNTFNIFMIMLKGYDEFHLTIKEFY